MGTTIIHANEPLDINEKIDGLVWNSDNTSNFKMTGIVSIKNNDGTVLQVTNGLGFTFLKENDLTDVYIDIAITDTSYLLPGDYQWTIPVYDNENNLIKIVFGSISVLDEEPRNIDRQIKPWDSSNDELLKVSRQKRNERLNICKTCERFNSDICLECGCIMTLKTMYAQFFCPIHKWEAEN